jgi:hypothetical protein
LTKTNLIKECVNNMAMMKKEGIISNSLFLLAFIDREAVAD